MNFQSVESRFKATNHRLSQIVEVHLGKNLDCVVLESVQN